MTGAASMSRTRLALLVAAAAGLAPADASTLRVAAPAPTATPSTVATTPMEGNCYAYTGQGGPRTACLPHIIIGGFPKCGTSALFALVSSHPNAVGTHTKEHCMFGNDTAAFLEGLPSKDALGGKRLVSGCIALETNEAVFDWLRPRDPTRVILLVRDFAEMAWASFNYWCLGTLDKDCAAYAGGWTLPGHYRSPELFHELVLMQKQGASNLLNSANVFEDPLPYTNRILRYERLVGSANVLVLDSDELRHSARSAWHKIAEFLGLGGGHPNLDLFEQRLYNTHAARGSQVYSKASAHQDGLYSISGNRHMLPQTRALLDAAWMHECRQLNQMYGLALKLCR